MDPPSHPLHQRNADFVIDQTLGDHTMETGIFDQIYQVLSLAGISKTRRKEPKTLALRQQLVLRSAQQILGALGASLDEAFKSTTMTENFEIAEDADKYKLTLTVHPVLRLDNDGREEGVYDANFDFAAALMNCESPQRKGSNTNDESENDDEDGSGDNDEDDSDSDDSDGSSSSSS